jgi:hypothetical protein
MPRRVPVKAKVCTASARSLPTSASWREKASLSPFQRPLRSLPPPLGLRPTTKGAIPLRTPAVLLRKPATSLLFLLFPWVWGCGRRNPYEERAGTVSRPEGEKSERRIEPVFRAGRKRARFRCHCPKPSAQSSTDFLTANLRLFALTATETRPVPPISCIVKGDEVFA